MSLRGYEKRDDLTESGNIVADLYYTAFSSEFHSYFPMYGTKNRNDGDTNALLINKPVYAYMARATAWTDVDVSGWFAAPTNTGNLLGPAVGDVELYEKYLDQGSHTLDNSNAYYLFRDGNAEYIYIYIYIYIIRVKAQLE